VVQIVSVVATILALRWNEWHFNLGLFSFVLSVNLVAHMAIWFMAAVSVISAVDYFWGFWKKIDTRVERRRRRPFILSRRRKKALQQAEANNPAKAH
jgi:CDP-diacylglycerol--glycerol-3-phosphate 3-phosphatidyltransferase